MMPSRAGAVAILAGAALTGGGMFACGDDTADSTRRGGVGSAEPMFRALEGDLVSTCGGPNGTCHVRGSYQQAPAWLGGPNAYVTIKKYRGVLPATRDVGDSILLTQVRHAGPALADAPNDLFRRVAEWLIAEVPSPPLPNTGKFSVQNGFNSVPLDAVASGLAGARVTFLATETNGTLTLSALKVIAPESANIKLDSPFFVVLPRSGKVKPDPQADGFQGELTVPAGTAADVFTGKVILLRWDPRGQLKLVFNQIETAPATAAAAGCTALDLFQSSALRAMEMPVEVLPDDGTGDPDAGEVVGRSSCLGCHAKTPPPNEAPSPAVQAMDLRTWMTDPATACAEAKMWIDTRDRVSSVILRNPTGRGNTLHPMKPVLETDPIIQGIRAWVDAER